MLRFIHLCAVSLFAVSAAATFAGCNAVDPSPEDENVGSAEQAVMSSGFDRIYFSDNTYSEAVGTEIYDCDPSNHFLDGEKTRFWKQHRFDCPGFDDPLLPSCELCTTYTTSNKQTFTSCTMSVCPIQ